MKILSLGGGVQSTTIALMIVEGELERIDAAIFADTQGESKGTYEHMRWLRGKMNEAGIPVHVVSAGNLQENILGALGRKKIGRVANPPFYVINKNGDKSDQGGTLWRGCTRDYKIVPIERQIRTLLGLSKGQRIPRAASVEQWYGISLDEYQRMRTNKRAWITNRYPLVEERMTRQDCKNWLTSHSYPIPPKSACVFCPYHTNGFWVHMLKNQPDEFAEVEDFDAALRNGDKLPGVTGEVFVHRRMLPLRQAVEMDFDERQGDLFGFEEVCDGGYCGV